MSSLSANAVKPNKTKSRSKSHDAGLSLRRQSWSLGRLFGRQDKEQREREVDISDCAEDPEDVGIGKQQSNHEPNHCGNTVKLKQTYVGIPNGQDLSDATSDNLTR